MKRVYRTILAITLALGSVGMIQAQGRPGGSAGRATSSSAARPATSARPAASARPATPTTRPATSARPATATTRPATNPSRPATSVRPGTSTKPAVNNRPATSPGANTKPAVRPGGNNSNRPGASVAPGHTPNRPGSSTVRPGTAANRPGGVRPGASHPATRPGSSVSRPGGWSPVVPLHNNWNHPGYRPPRPGGGYWAAPAPSRWRIGYWVPPVPPRYTYAVVGAPTLGTLLGLTFGSFIDAGINSLYNAGYNVAGYADNVIYLTNVTQLGFLWPEVAMQYTNGLLSNGQFSYYSATPGMGRYNSLFQQLCLQYGNPVANTNNTTTWWAGDNTGYITLHYAYMNSLQGVPGYYTTLTYSAYY